MGVLLLMYPVSMLVYFAQAMVHVLAESAPSAFDLGTLHREVVFEVIADVCVAEFAFGRVTVPSCESVEEFIVGLYIGLCELDLWVKVLMKCVEF